MLVDIHLHIGSRGCPLLVLAGREESHASQGPTQQEEGHSSWWEALKGKRSGSVPKDDSK